MAALVLSAALLGACSRDAQAPQAGGHRAERARAAQVTVQGDDRIAGTLTWRTPEVSVPADGREAARRRAAAALAAGRLYADAGSAIPLYLALLEQQPDDAAARKGLQEALVALLAQGDEALAGAGDDIAALRAAHQVAAVARAAGAGEKSVQDYLGRVDAADHLWELNRRAEADLHAGRFGETGGGALAGFREVLRLHPGQGRAMQGLAAVESGLIRRAEEASRRDDFTTATRWMDAAAAIRPGSDTIADARARIAQDRTSRIAQLRDEGLQALLGKDGLAQARGKLAQILRIATPGDPVAAGLRERIDLATHYGLFHPGQVFTDALRYGARSPEMVVIPHGAYRMGATAGDAEAADSEKPAHYVRFDRGFAMSRTEVTVDQFRRFVDASGYRPTASKHGFSLVYEERNGNFVRHGHVDWRSGYDGSPAADDMPVLHVSARDAAAYAAWLAEQSGQRYRLPSEAEFEYALRAGSTGRFPWGDGVPGEGAGNFTGARDVSAGGRHWSNAFAGYADGFWGPAPVARFQPNAYGLHDLAGNVSEWVADCWHDGYRRAPEDGDAWFNPGCRTRVVRGGAWASSPAQTRSAWRSPAGADTTNARIGFRVVRDL